MIFQFCFLGLFVCVLASISSVRKPENSKGFMGAALKRGKINEKS
jgi:hypothetical protein